MRYQYQQQRLLYGSCNINTNINKQNTAFAVPISITISKTTFLQYQYHLNMGKFCNNAISIPISPSVTVLSHSPVGCMGLQIFATQLKIPGQLFSLLTLLVILSLLIFVKKLLTLLQKLLRWQQSWLYKEQGFTPQHRRVFTVLHKNC